jgi:septum formation protein
MLTPWKERIKQIKIVLASSSPQRLIICRSLGIEPVVIPSTFEEDHDWRVFASAKEYAKFNAIEKSKHVSESDWDILISADSVVEVDGVVLEKPLDRNHAEQMIRSLRNKPSSVHTALVVKTKNSELSSVTSTQVYFSDFSDEVLQGYLDARSWEGKAGGYGIQTGEGGSLIYKIEGDYYNVAGLPLHELCKLLVETLSSLTIH